MVIPSAMLNACIIVKRALRTLSSTSFGIRHQEERALNPAEGLDRRGHDGHQPGVLGPVHGAPGAPL